MKLHNKIHFFLGFVITITFSYFTYCCFRLTIETINSVGDLLGTNYSDIIPFVSFGILGATISIFSLKLLIEELKTLKILRGIRNKNQS